MMKNVIVPDLFFVWCGVLLRLTQIASVAPETRIVASSPVNPVDQGGILAVHCQVWNMRPEDEVVVLRTVDDKTEKLSDGPDADLEERIFIAVRQMEDGSTVYFISLTRVSKADGGEYSCTVMRFSKQIMQIATDAVEISIVHFPTESSPKCASSVNDKLAITEGMPITLNCSSSLGNPPVKISWHQVGSDKELPSRKITSGDTIYAELTVRPMANSPVYICQIQSVAFPDRTETCHIGPLVVMRDSNSPRLPYITKYSPTTPETNPVVVATNIHSDIKSSNCRSICASRTYSGTFYWIVGTVAMAILAILFFIIFIAILLRYLRRLRNNNLNHYKVPYEHRGGPPHKVYEELEIRRCGGQVYMALDKSKNLANESAYTDGGQLERLDHVSNEPMILR